MEELGTSDHQEEVDMFATVCKGQCQLNGGGWEMTLGNIQLDTIHRTRHYDDSRRSLYSPSI